MLIYLYLYIYTVIDFRSMSVQPTDFENAAFSVFVVLSSFTAFFKGSNSISEYIDIISLYSRDHLHSTLLIYILTTFIFNFYRSLFLTFLRFSEF